MIRVEYEKSEAYTSHVDILLRGLIMEDLLVEEESSNRKLMVSSAFNQPDKRQEKKTSMRSTSCPDLTGLRIPRSAVSKSLPGSLEPTAVFGVGVGGRECTAASRGRRDKTAAPPQTPPPSVSRHLVIIFNAS